MATEKEIDYSEEFREIDTYNAKCPSCGSTMQFDPDTQSLKCQHCGTEEQIQKDFEVKEIDIVKGFEDAEKWSADEQVTFKCNNCGAVVVLSIDEEASNCPFCGTSHIAKEGSFEGVRPHSVIPFQFGNEKATELSKQWARSRIFAPRKFKKSLTPERIKGIYEPCFTFDSNTFSNYYGRVGDRHTRVVGSGKNKRTETYVVYRNVRGTFEHFFDDVTIATNENFSQKELNKLSPFAMNKACVYEKKYLSGFMADGYQRNLDECWGDAKSKMTRDVRSMIISRLHCDVVDYLNVSTVHNDVTFKYMLLPVYTAVYRFKKKNYTLRINGSTGKVKGKTPVSPLRVIIASVLGFAVCAFFVWLFANYS